MNILLGLKLYEFSKYPSKILKFKLFNFIIFAIAVVICF